MCVIYTSLYCTLQQGISEMLQQKNVRLDETQVCEAAELRRKLQSELELLMAYQVSLIEKIIFRNGFGYFDLGSTRCHDHSLSKDRRMRYWVTHSRCYISFANGFGSLLLGSRSFAC